MADPTTAEQQLQNTDPNAPVEVQHVEPLIQQAQGNSNVPNLSGVTGKIKFGAWTEDYIGAVMVGHGWLKCDGSLVLRADYPELYAAIGDAWGANDGSTNFRLPTPGGRAIAVGSADNPAGTLYGNDFQTIPAHQHHADHGHPGNPINDLKTTAAKQTATPQKFNIGTAQTLPDDSHFHLVSFTPSVQDTSGFKTLESDPVTVDLYQPTIFIQAVIKT